jgi:hypothetical protein
MQQDGLMIIVGPHKSFSFALCLFWCLVLVVANGQSQPRIFFSDLESGPNSGGQDNKGAFVTIWGKGFGSIRGSSRVTVGGGAVDTYPVWSDEKITFQLGPGTRTGNIVVTTGGLGEAASNGLPFKIRPGKIYFVAVKGNDGGGGSFNSPWQTIVHAKNSMSRGDITYIEDGVKQASQDSFDAYLSMDRNGAANSGVPGAPKALVAYPGATVTIGQARGLHYGVRTPNIDAPADYWVFSQLHIIGGVQAMDISGVGWKIVGNEMQCPGADDQVGCFQASVSSQLKFYGNEVHNAGVKPRSSKFYHAVYFSTDSNHIDVGWNHIHDNYTCRAIQFHSSPLCRPRCGDADKTGNNQYDLHVHDNLIHGDNCNGINFATVDPSQGPVEAYNNVVYHVGLQDPLEGGGGFSCIYVGGITNTGRPGAGTVEVFNNTVSDCGRNNSGDSGGERGAFNVGRSWAPLITRFRNSMIGGGTSSLVMRLRNNIAYQLPGEVYIDGDKTQITGERNLWFGAGPGPSQTAGNINVDPGFVNRTTSDFRLSASSPAKDAGVTVLPANPFIPGAAQVQTSDKDGVPRLAGKACAIGAYETAAPVASAGP